MILTLLDFLWIFSKDPLLLLMLVFTLIILFLLARLYFGGRRVLEKDLEGPLEIVDDEDPILIDLANFREIRPVQVKGNVDNSVQVDEQRVDAEVKSLFNAEGPDACKYCFIFKDLSSIVCPNCGRLLNFSPRDE